MIRYLSLQEFAEQADLEFDTMKAYRRRGLLPAEDAQIGRNRGWKPAVTRHWIDNRPGQGARTDRHPSPASRHTPIPVRYWSLHEFAENAGHPFDTMKAYRRRGLLPAEDAQIGRNRGWKPATGQRWIAEHPRTA